MCGPEFPVTSLILIHTEFTLYTPPYISITQTTGLKSKMENGKPIIKIQINMKIN